MPRRVLCGIAFLTAGWTATTHARDAAHAAVALTYEVDGPKDGCPSELDLRQGVAKQLGYDPFAAVAAAHHVVARIHVAPTATEGELEWSDANDAREGERRLSTTNGDCAALGRAMTFALSVQIELIGGPATRVDVSPPPPPASPEPVRRSSPRYALGLGPLLSVGSTPEAMAGVRVFAAGRSGAASLELGAQASLSTAFRRADGTGFDARALDATLALCGHWRWLAVCPLGTVGTLLVAGFGVDEPRSPSAFIARAGLRAALEPRIWMRWVVGLHADALATLTPRTISLNQMPVWTTPAVTVTVGVDLGLQVR